MLLGQLEAAGSEAEERETCLGRASWPRFRRLVGMPRARDGFCKRRWTRSTRMRRAILKGILGLGAVRGHARKARTAQRLLGEMDTIAPGHRAREVAALKAGMEG